MIKQLIQKAFKDERTLRAITGMSRRQLQELCVIFEKAFNDESYQTIRVRRPGGGRKNTLLSIKEKVFFLLFYLKVYPTYDLMGVLCLVDRSQICRWVKKLLPLLEKALGYSISLPKRKITSLQEFQETFPEIADILIDVTERRCQRPKSTKNLRRQYSGKKKSHTRKNTLIVSEEKYIHFLSPTKNGRIHDLTLFKKEAITPHIPNTCSLWIDKGYTGIQALLPEGVEVHIPHKKKKNQTLSKEQKAENQAINGLRIPVEHAIGGMKRYGCMQIPIRNKDPKLEDQLPLLCAGLWNFHLKRK